MINKANTIADVQFLVTISINDFSKEHYSFSTLDRAKEYFKSSLELIFAEEKITVDEDGQSIDECVKHHYAIVDGNVHTIDLVGFMG